MDGNEQYGASFAVAFLETLYSFGHTAFTQAQFAARMQTVVYSTPSITPLHYTATNHQGLLCAVMSVIKSTGHASGEFITTPSHVVKCSTDSATSPITTGVYKVTAVPAYLS